MCPPSRNCACRLDRPDRCFERLKARVTAWLKTWEGREDNEHLSEIVNTLDADAASFRDDVYRALQARYPNR